MATFLYRVKVNNALNLKMKVVQFEDVWMGDLGLDVKTECESGMRQKRMWVNVFSPCVLSL